MFFGTPTTNSPICTDLGCFTTEVVYNAVANNTMRCVGRGVPIRITYRNQATLYVYDNAVEGKPAGLNFSAFMKELAHPVHRSAVGPQYVRLDGTSTTSIYINGAVGVNWAAK